MPSRISLVAAPLGRLLLSGLFLMSAANKLANWDQIARLMADKGLPAVDVLLSIAVALEIVGGLMVLLGLQARWGAALLLLFLVPVTLIMHNFWAAPEAQQQAEMGNFMKNVTIAGGLLMVLALGAGPVSIDNRPRRQVPSAAP